MKHQYFGDVNDYRKYGLLRAILRETDMRLGVWWMLTPDDGRSDGKFTAYLGDPQRWRRHDPVLFDELSVAVPVHRSVATVQERDLLAGALFVDSLVPDSAAARAASFAAARESLGGTDLVFLDPDNGLEVASCPPGHRGSSKYVLRAEVTQLFADGCSLLVYQHFRREERSAFVRRTAALLRSDTGAPLIVCFQTSNVAFFLLSRPEHEARLRAASASVSTEWGDQIRPWVDPDAQASEATGGRV